MWRPQTEAPTYLSNKGKFSLDKFLNYQPRQQAFFQACFDKTFILYGGAKGGAKSYSLRGNLLALHVYWAARGIENITTVMICMDYPRLMDRQITKLNQWPAYIGEVRRTSVAGLGFYLTPDFGGGMIALRNLKDTKSGLFDNTQFKSAEFAAVAFDELTEIEDRRVFDVLRSSMRYPGIDHIPFMAATNPDGPGMEWVRDLWIKRDFPREYVESGIDKEFTFVPALPTDNKYLDKSYWQMLRSQPKDLQKAWIEGNWYVFSGRAFKEFSIEKHVIDPITEFDATWSIKTGHDYGLSAPFAALWGAKNLITNRIIIYKELYEVLSNDRLQAKKIVDWSTERERWSRHWADPHYWDNKSQENGLLTSAADIYRQNGVILTKGNNDRRAGKRQIMRLLDPLEDGLPGLLVTSNCVNLIKQIQSMQHDPNDPEDVYTNNHIEDHCFIAETLVTTDKGDVPISKVIAGDKVLTRQGYKEVLSSWMTYLSSKVIKVKFSNGSSLTGTGNHPIWVEGFGWRRLDALRYHDIINTWTNAAKQSSSMEQSTEGFPTVLTGQTSITTPQAEATNLKIKTICTETSGASTTEKYHLGIRFITKIKTLSTMICQTLSAYLRRSIVRDTASQKRNSNGYASTLPRSDRLPSFGTSLRQGMTGTLNTEKNVLATDQNLLIPVKLAGKNTRSLIPAPKDQGTVLQTAKQLDENDLELIMKNVFALSAELHSQSIDTPEKSAAPVYVLGHSVENNQAVYNLEVEGANEYYANGILVHNCYDTLRYLLSGESDKKKKPPKEKVLSPLADPRLQAHL